MLELADHVAAGREDDIGVHRLVAVHEDLRDQRLVAGLRDDEMDVCGPVRMAAGDPQQVADRSVDWHRVGGRHQRNQVVCPGRVGLELAAEVVVGLAFVLVLVESVGGGLPDRQCCPGDRGACGQVVDPPGDADALTRRIGAHDGLAPAAQRGVRPVKGADERESDRRRGPVVVDDLDKLADSDHVSKQEEFVALGTRESGHPRHEVPGELPFLLTQLDLFDQGMEMPDQGGHDLPKPGFLNVRIGLDRPRGDRVARMATQHDILRLSEFSRGLYSKRPCRIEPGVRISIRWAPFVTRHPIRCS